MQKFIQGLHLGAPLRFPPDMPQIMFFFNLARIASEIVPIISSEHPPGILQGIHSRIPSKIPQDIV